MIDLLSKLSDFPEISIPQGQSIIVEDKNVTHLYFLISGTMGVWKDGCHISEISDAGAIFGEMSLLLESPATATATASTDCVVKRVDDFDQFMAEYPEVGHHISITLARRLDSLTRYMADIKIQFKDRADHLEMIDQVMNSIMNKHPRFIEKRMGERDLVDD